MLILYDIFTQDKPKQESAEKPKVEETKPVVPMPTKEKSR
jgi:hypothetical protein